MYKKVNRVTVFVAMLIVAIAVLPAAGFAAETSGVARSVTPAGQGEYDVTIKLNDSLPTVVGIKEQWPDGCTFVSCSLPQDRYTVSGTTAMFAVINTTEFQYRVKGASPEQATGEWADMLGRKEGTIGAPGGDAGTTKTDASAAPGFEAFLALAAAGSAAYLAGRR